MKSQDFFADLEKNSEYKRAQKELRFKFRLANAIIAARLKKGWTQAELAEKVRTRQANISRIEASLTNPTLELIRRLCDVLDIEMAFSGPSIPEGPIEKNYGEISMIIISEDFTRVDDQDENIFYGNYEIKTEQSIQTGELN